MEATKEAIVDIHGEGQNGDELCLLGRQCFQRSQMPDLYLLQRQVEDPIPETGQPVASIMRNDRFAPGCSCGIAVHFLLWGMMHVDPQVLQQAETQILVFAL